MDVLSREAERFIHAAEVAGMELPASITDRLKSLEAMKADRAKLGRPEKVPTKTELLANGIPLAKVTEEDARLEREARDLKELHEAAFKAEGLVARQVSIAVAQERVDLIMALRPLVTNLVEKARPLAESLARFAPKYDAGAIVRHATPAQIRDWRSAEELEARFGACLAAWRSAWSASTTLGGHQSDQVKGFDSRWVDQSHYYWEWPARVLEPRLNGTYYAPHRSAPSVIRPTLLAVASERPECGFRLATVQEVAELYRTGRRTGQAPGGGLTFDTTPVTA